MTHITPLFVTAEEFRNALAIGATTFERLIKEGVIPREACRIGNRRRWKWEDAQKARETMTREDQSN